MGAILAALLLGQVAAEKPARPLVPVDAVKVCLEDVSQAGHHAAFYRYVFVSTGEADHAIATDAVMNIALSRSDEIVRGHRLGDGIVLRYDFRHLAPKEAELKELLDTWEKLAEDEPYFLVDAQEFTADVHTDVITILRETLIQTPTGDLGKAAQGQTFEIQGEQNNPDGSWWEIETNGQQGFIAKTDAQKKTTTEKAEKIQPRVFGLHCGTEAGEIAIACASDVPIVRWDYFLRVALSNIEKGLYYEFRGIKASPDENVSDLDFLLETFAGVTEFQVLKVGNEQGVAMVDSDVTKKPRAVLLFSGNKSQVTVNQNIVALTQDISGDIIKDDPLSDPAENLLRARFQGIELFIELPNGMTLYSLHTGDLNGDGKYDPNHKNEDGEATPEGQLVREVPPDIATDGEVPDQHPARLQPAISCIRCHNKKRGDVAPEGWLGLPNDVKKLYAAKVNIFGDRTDREPKAETLEILHSRYKGDFSDTSKVMRRLRDDAAEAFLKIAGRPGQGEESITTEVYSILTKTYNAYWFQRVTPEIACRELGVETKTEAEAIEQLNRILPPRDLDKFGISQEDAYIGYLKAGVAIPRPKWEIIYPVAAYRQVKALEQNQNQKVLAP